MNPSSIILLLSLTSLSAVSRAGLVPHKAQVLIYNDLAQETDLIVHCKSKDDDLGVQHITYGNYFEFDFRPNFFGNTLFYCSMQWNGTTQWFDIYDQLRDEIVCDRCVWKVRPDGPCNQSYYGICYSWKSPA
ncbi:hypothetical protein like AT3G16970 [Hibiscus trionum]|uniref:S-protein homolog n=1 Tax=Hibiscus trionum TaxID=183268 RepID=A0A9W7LNY0_HIBTR|nr:hypothetical protein like AT3G16970 [Hibiscus trionum]